jgi:hypothetical protein
MVVGKDMVWRWLDFGKVGNTVDAGPWNRKFNEAPVFDQFASYKAKEVIAALLVDSGTKAN